jgi:CHAT domain-containing protein/tetratricopeptide (TPR) repeat protein
VTSTQRYSRTLHNLAIAKRKLGKLEEAERLFSEALELTKEQDGERSLSYALTLSSIGLVHREAGRFTEALGELEHALEICRTVDRPDPRVLADIVNTLGECLHATGEYDRAEALYREAIELFRTLDYQSPLEISCLYNLADLCAATRRPVEALDVAEEAEAAYDRLTEAVFATTSEQQRLEHLNRVSANRSVFLSIGLRQPTRDAPVVRRLFDLVLRRKGIVIDALNVDRRAAARSADESTTKLLDQLGALRREESRLALASAGDESGSAQDTLTRLRGRRELLEAESARRLAPLAAGVEVGRVPTVTVDDVGAALPQGAALVEIVRVVEFDFEATGVAPTQAWKGGRYLAFVLGDQGASPTLVELGSADEIDALIAEWRSALLGEVEETESRGAAGPQSRDMGSPEPSPEKLLTLRGRKLRRRVLDPIVAVTGGLKLLVAPDGEIARLPFEALPLEDERYVLDEHDIAYLATARDLCADTASPATPGPPIVMADPDFDVGSSALDGFRPDSPWRRLGGAQDEGREVGRVLGVEPLMGPGAQTDTLVSARNPRILHVATHAFFVPPAPVGATRLAALAGFPNPMLRSGLVLAGANTWAQGGPARNGDAGILTAHEASGLDLSSTELVVLSACQTGTGTVHAGEGVFGLRRALALAGARSVVMSLWKVPDPETRDLMVAFYRALPSSGGPAAALQTAKRMLRARVQHPYYWGAFISVGR